MAEVEEATVASHCICGEKTHVRHKHKKKGEGGATVSILWLVPTVLVLNLTHVR